MQRRAPIDVSYDAIGDVLYMGTEKGVRTLNLEETPGIILRYGIQTQTPIGITILDYKEYWTRKRETLVSQIAAFFKVSKSEAERLLASADEHQVS